MGMKGKEHFGLDLSLGYNLTFLDSWPRHFNKWASSIQDSSTSGLHNPRHCFKWASSTHIFLNKKNGAFGYANSQTRNIYKAMGNINYSHRMPQVPRVLGGLMLILIFATHFVQARFKQAQLSCELNSCIIFYFIFLSMAQAHATYEEIEEVWFGGYGSVPFGPFTWAQPIRATKWARDTGSTSGLWRRSCIQNFHPKIAFMLCVTVAQSFYSNPFFSFKNGWLSLANFSC